MPLTQKGLPMAPSQFLPFWNHLVAIAKALQAAEIPGSDRVEMWTSSVNRPPIDGEQQNRVVFTVDHTIERAKAEFERNRSHPYVPGNGRHTPMSELGEYRF